MKEEKNEKKKMLPILKSLSKMKSDEIAHSVDCLSDQTIDGICECVYNVIFTDLKLSPRKKSILKKHLKQKCSIQRLKKITNKSWPVSKRRLLLKQEGSGLPLLLMTAVPFIIDLIKSAVSK